MKVLIEILLFLGTFFGIFILISAICCVIFPTTWNNVVTCIPWVAMYVLFGGILAGFVVDDYSKS